VKRDESSVQVVGYFDLDWPFIQEHRRTTSERLNVNMMAWKALDDAAGQVGFATMPFDGRAELARHFGFHRTNPRHSV
jgi:hypothetical protein